jgi:AraC-like DNA-binding protein
MQQTVMISFDHYRKAGKLAEHIRLRCKDHGWEGLRVGALCKEFATSESILTRAFKQRFAITIHAFIIQEKMALAKSMLSENILPVREIAYVLGYSELSNFSRDFSRCFRESPNAYRRSATSLAARHPELRDTRLYRTS